MNNAILILKKRYIGWICFIFSFVIILSSCKKNKDNKPEYAVGTNEHINTWILDSLKRYYYWNESLPSNPNIGFKPQDFFNAVRNTADRFSYIILPNNPLTFPSSNKNFGFDYTTIQEQTTGQVIGIVTLVLNDSPASRSGLKRGDYIRKVNGQQLTSANATVLQQEILNGNHFTLGLAELNGNTWLDIRSIEIDKGVILDQKETSKIIKYEGKKIAYLYFQDFNHGLAASLYTVFSDFKNAGVSDLILDLRYNSGGQVAEAAAICAMIAQGVSYEQPFVIYKGNKNGGTNTESFGSAATFDGTVKFNIVLQRNLGLSRIFILGTSATASAAEMMINNLKPYIGVTLIGEKTRGKDEASFKIFDKRVPKLVQWEMHPVIYKLFNADGGGNYSNGITPDVFVNELSFLPLQPFGEIKDPLIQSAISLITGKVTVSAKRAKQVNTTNVTISKVLLNTRTQVSQNSIVITHR